MPRTVLTIGTFDTLHEGHLELLAACRDIAQGGVVVVAVNPSDFVREYKGHWPTQTTADRERALIARPEVNRVLTASGRSCAETIAEVGPDVIAVGDDWLPLSRYLAQLGVTDRWLRQRGISVRFIGRTTGQSSTKIREANQ